MESAIRSEVWYSIKNTQLHNPLVFAPLVVQGVAYVHLCMTRAVPVYVGLESHRPVRHLQLAPLVKTTKLFSRYKSTSGFGLVVRANRSSARICQAEVVLPRRSGIDLIPMKNYLLVQMTLK